MEAYLMLFKKKKRTPIQSLNGKSSKETYLALLVICCALYK